MVSDQVLWARETEHSTQTLVFTKTAGRHNVVESLLCKVFPARKVHIQPDLTYWEVSQQTYVQTLQAGLGVS